MSVGSMSWPDHSVIASVFYWTHNAVWRPNLSVNNPKIIHFSTKERSKNTEAGLRVVFAGVEAGRKLGSESRGWNPGASTSRLVVTGDWVWEAGHSDRGLGWAKHTITKEHILRGAWAVYCGATLSDSNVLHPGGDSASLQSRQQTLRCPVLILYFPFSSQWLSVEDCGDVTTRAVLFYLLFSLGSWTMDLFWCGQLCKGTVEFML